MSAKNDVWSVNLSHRPEVADTLRTYQNEYGLTRSEVMHRAVNCLLEFLESRDGDR